MTPTLELKAVLTSGITYSFQTTGPGFKSWALCTVNDATGELFITSDWGSWSHRWDARPSSLGHPTLTAFIGERADVDYIARKLQREGNGGRRFSAEATIKALRRQLCRTRLEHGRERLESRLDPDDMLDGEVLPHLRDRYDADGLPLDSHRMPIGYRMGRPYDIYGNVYRLLPFLTRDVARRIWEDLGELDGDSSDMFLAEAAEIDGLDDYVTDEPWNYCMTEQTPEDRMLRDVVLPALIRACKSGFVAWPADQPRQYNGSGEPCDMWIGPCSCGATHTAEQRARIGGES